MRIGLVDAMNQSDNPIYIVIDCAKKAGWSVESLDIVNGGISGERFASLMRLVGYGVQKCGDRFCLKDADGTIWWTYAIVDPYDPELKVRVYPHLKFGKLAMADVLYHLQTISDEYRQLLASN